MKETFIAFVKIAAVISAGLLIAFGLGTLIAALEMQEAQASSEATSTAPVAAKVDTTWACIQQLRANFLFEYQTYCANQYPEGSSERHDCYNTTYDEATAEAFAVAPNTPAAIMKDYELTESTACEKVSRGK